MIKTEARNTTLTLIQLRRTLKDLTVAPDQYDKTELRVQLVKDNINILEGKITVH